MYSFVFSGKSISSYEKLLWLNSNIQAKTSQTASFIQVFLLSGSAAMYLITTIQSSRLTFPVQNLDFKNQITLGLKSRNMSSTTRH